MLEARVRALHGFGNKNGVWQNVKIGVIDEMAKEGYKLETIITPRPSPEVILGVFYREVPAPEKKDDAPAKNDVPKKRGRPKKSDA